MKKITDKSKKSELISLRVTPEKYEEIVGYAVEKGISISALMALAVSEYIKKN